MKRDKIVYWITTGLVAAMMFFSAYMYLTMNPQLVEGFKAIGFPTFFITILGCSEVTWCNCVGSACRKIVERVGLRRIYFHLHRGSVDTHCYGHSVSYAGDLLGILGVSYLFWTRLLRSAISR
ncbi:MAG: DoxX family protein [Bacteroidota bacterium]